MAPPGLCANACAYEDEAAGRLGGLDPLAVVLTTGECFDLAFPCWHWRVPVVNSLMERSEVVNRKHGHWLEVKLCWDLEGRALLIKRMAGCVNPRHFAAGIAIASEDRSVGERQRPTRQQRRTQLACDGVGRQEWLQWSKRSPKLQNDGATSRRRCSRDRPRRSCAVVARRNISALAMYYVPCRLAFTYLVLGQRRAPRRSD
jgi:hypothetical protein